MSRFVLAAFLAAISSAALAAGALAAAPGGGAMLETLEQAYASAIREAIGAPARADLGDEATERLEAPALIVPKDPAAHLLAFTKLKVPPDFVALLLGSEGMEAPGMVRFVPSGFVAADEALSWSADDFLASLNDTLEKANKGRIQHDLAAVEARRWISPVRYDPERHQLEWAALVVPKTAPRETDGEVTYHAIGFGRDGYVELSVVSSVEKADAIGSMMRRFLVGLNFVPGKGFNDVQPSDRRAPGGLAAAIGVDSLHKAVTESAFWSSDPIIPLAGSAVAAVGALGLVIAVHRHMKRLRRRV